MKILLTDAATIKANNDLSFDCLRQFGDLFTYESITKSELLREIVDTDLLLCNKTIIDESIMKNSPTLKYVGLFATGYNNIDVEYAKQKGIVVCNAGSYSTNAVAQQVIAYILNHYTRISEYDAFVKDGGWQRSPVFSPFAFATDEVFGKTLGIIGYGNIAKAVEKIALALGMRVLIHTRTIRENNPKFVSLAQLLSQSDVVSVHCPLNEQSREMFNQETFKLFKDGAYFINTARGSVINETALFNALESGKLGGAAIDVLTTEPMPADCFLKNAKNIIITPHTAWAPLTTRKRLLQIVCDNISAFLQGNPKNNVAR